MEINLIVILGPTAAGKTRLAAKLAVKFNGEIISADSRQVYKKMNIGTGKDLADYIVCGKTVPYHLIDIIEPYEEFNLYEFNKRFYDSFRQIINRGKIPFLVGGTGLYLHSILKGYKLTEAGFSGKRYDQLNSIDLDELVLRLQKINKDLHNTTDLKIKERVIRAIIVSESNEEANEKNNIIKPLIIGVKIDREESKKLITRRLKKRLDEGMIDEVKALIKIGISLTKLEFFGLEYKFVGRYVEGKLNYNDMFQKLNSAIHQFAKRQMTWFRKMEKEGIKIIWIDGADYNEAEKIISSNI